MSTFLELAQQLRAEVDIAGTGPTAVTAQTGDNADLVRWITQAYRDIQLRHATRWRWLRRGFTFNTVASTSQYAYTAVTDVDAGTAIARFRAWRLDDPEDPPKIYLTSGGISGQRWLLYAPWEWFKMVYKIGSNNTQEGAPAHIAVDPQNNLHLGPIPNDTYTVTGDFHRSAQVLAANDDEPEMPEDFHDLIVYEAMKKYGYKAVAQEQLARAAAEGRRMMRQLERDQLDRISLAGPLA